MPVVFDHIALATHRIADAPGFLVGELGGVSGFGGPSGPYRWWHWDYAGGGRIEVLEPDGPPGGFVHRFLESRGPGIHHTTFKVPSLDETCSRAKGLGYEIVGYDDRDPRWKEAFLHPKQAMGIVVQLVETHFEGDEEPRWGEPPPEPASPPPAVSVVGVRMRTADRERAVRQWGELIGGDLDEAPGEVRFRWPGSAMRVAVTLERGSADVSEAIELRADRPLSLPEGPHPVLGAVFRQLGD
jgi:hypothetical protein